MFLGFITAIITILLVIILFSTGLLDNYIGAQNTKSTKIITEINSLSQSIKIYKSISKEKNYKEINLDKLVELGIIKYEDLVNSNNSMFYLDQTDFNTSNISKLNKSEKNIIASKAIKGLFYNIKENKNNYNEFIFEIIIDKSLDGIGFKEKDYLLENSLEHAYKKFEKEATVNTGIDNSKYDGIATILFK